MKSRIVPSVVPTFAAFATTIVLLIGQAPLVG